MLKKFTPIIIIIRLSRIATKREKKIILNKQIKPDCVGRTLNAPGEGGGGGGIPI